MEYGGFVLTFEPERTQWVAEHLHADMNLTESFSAVDWTFNPRELVFLVLEQDPLAIGALAVMEPMHGSGGSAKRKMRMVKPILVFHQMVQVSELGGFDLASAVGTPERMRRLEPSTWNTLIARVCGARPADEMAINQIIARRTEQHLLMDDGARVARLNEQRDGLGLALDIGGLDRAQTLKTMKIDGVAEAESILDLLDSTTIQERSLLEHDRRIFELLLGQQPTSAVLFSDGASDRSVRVLVVDRSDLETVLGIDLIIYHATYENYLLLQYKRMEKWKDGWRYPIPPSSDLHGQMRAMETFRSAAAALPTASPSLWNYRLNEEPFYFKFCEQIRPAARDDSLIPGITLSAVHLAQFLDLPAARKGGSLSVGHHNCPRYLNNTEFTQLAQNGWIGAGSQSADLMKDVLQANARGGRAAMLAVIETPQSESAAGRGRRH